MSSTEQSPVRQQQQEEPLAKASLDSDEASSSTVSSAPPGASVAAKTPVSLLQELYVRRGITPKYDLVQIEGAVHEPTFKYRVTVGEFVATGCGQSKKKAKHSAAKAVLERIRCALFLPPLSCTVYNPTNIDSVEYTKGDLL